MFDIEKVRKAAEPYEFHYRHEFFADLDKNDVSRRCKVIYLDGDTHIVTDVEEAEVAGFSGHMYFRQSNGDREIYQYLHDSGWGLYGISRKTGKGYFSRGCSMAIIASTDPTLSVMEIPADFLEKYEDKKRDVDMLNVSYLKDKEEIHKIEILPHSVLYRAEKYVEGYVRPRHDLDQPFLYADFIQTYIFGAEFGKDRN